MAETGAAKLVRDLMTVGVDTCKPNTPIVELARMLLEKEVEDIVVLDEGHAIGTVGQSELVLAFTREDFRSLKAEDVMREGILQSPPDIPLAAAAQYMHDQGVRTLFLTHHAGGIEYPAALISYWHLLRYLAAEDEDGLRDMGILAERKSPIEQFITRRDAARRANTK